jgi:hypothetical protein
MIFFPSTLFEPTNVEPGDIEGQLYMQPPSWLPVTSSPFAHSLSFQHLLTPLTCANLSSLTPHWPLSLECDQHFSWHRHLGGLLWLSPTTLHWTPCLLWAPHTLACDPLLIVSFHPEFLGLSQLQPLAIPAKNKPATLTPGPPCLHYPNLLLLPASQPTVSDSSQS